MFWPCETRTSTCRNFATISSGVYRFFGIAVLLHVKRHSSGRTTSKGEDQLSDLTDIDLSHDNPMWRYYEYSSEERRHHGLEGLAEYLPADEGGNRDIGSFQAGVMRFGAKHNDIYPIIGDMIRWKLGLSARHIL